MLEILEPIIRTSYLLFVRRVRENRKGGVDFLEGFCVSDGSHGGIQKGGVSGRNVESSLEPFSFFPKMSRRSSVSLSSVRIENLHPEGV